MNSDSYDLSDDRLDTPLKRHDCHILLNAISRSLVYGETQIAVFRIFSYDSRWNSLVPDKLGKTKLFFQSLVFKLDIGEIAFEIGVSFEFSGKKAEFPSQPFEFSD